MKILTIEGNISCKTLDEFISKRDYTFLKSEKSNFSISYLSTELNVFIVDRFASFPLYYTNVQDIIYVSNDVNDLVQKLGVVKFDPIGFFGCEFLFGSERIVNTPIKNILRIEPGTILEVKDGKCTFMKYWSFQEFKDRPFLGEFEEAAEELNFLVRQSMDRILGGGQKIGLHFSGGQDSGLLTSLACQSELKEIHAYSIGANEDQNDSNNEGFWVNEFEKTFDKLQITNFNWSQIESYGWKSYSIGDWLKPSTECINESIASNAKSANVKYIITGLGGDEIVSYEGGFSKNTLTVSNFTEANIFIMYRRNYLRWRNYLSLIIKRKNGWKEKMLIQKIRNQSSFFFNTTIKKWCNDEFLFAVQDKIKTRRSGSVSYKCSYNFRLELLDKEYFTIRSDIWNQIGRNYGVAYLHPLLDSDLVSFMATMPVKFYTNRKTRELFNSGIEDLVPQAFNGPKRWTKSFDAEKVISTQELTVILKTLIFKIESIYRGSFANEVYNFQYMYLILKEYQSILKTLPDSYVGFRQKLTELIDKCQYIMRYGDYLNYNFN